MPTGVLSPPLDTLCNMLLSACWQEESLGSRRSVYGRMRESLLRAEGWAGEVKDLFKKALMLGNKILFLKSDFSFHEK